MYACQQVAREYHAEQKVPATKYHVTSVRRTPQIPSTLEKQVGQRTKGCTNTSSSLETRKKGTLIKENPTAFSGITPKRLTTPQ